MLHVESADLPCAKLFHKFFLSLRIEIKTRKTENEKSIILGIGSYCLVNYLGVLDPNLETKYRWKKRLTMRIPMFKKVWVENCLVSLKLKLLLAGRVFFLPRSHVPPREESGEIVFEVEKQQTAKFDSHHFRIHLYS